MPNPFFPSINTNVKPAIYKPVLPFGWDSISTFIGLPPTKATIAKKIPVYIPKKTNKHALSVAKKSAVVSESVSSKNPLKKYFIYTGCVLVFISLYLLTKKFFK